MSDSRNGYLFHGGCHGCKQPLSVCPTCCYMKPDWSLSSRNQEETRREKEREEMIRQALVARENGDA